MPSSTQCIFCEHYQGELRCKAFPENIPVKIASGLFTHTKVYGKEKKDSNNKPFLYKEKK